MMMLLQRLIMLRHGMTMRHLEQNMLKQPDKKEQNTGHLLIQAEQTGYGLLWLSTEKTGQVDSKTKQMYSLIQ